MSLIGIGPFAFSIPWERHAEYYFSVPRCSTENLECIIGLSLLSGLEKYELWVGSILLCNFYCVFNKTLKEIHSKKAYLFSLPALFWLLRNKKTGNKNFRMYLKYVFFFSLYRNICEMRNTSVNDKFCSKSFNKLSYFTFV